MRWIVSMLRESRGARGRLGFFTACIAIGVAAVVGVASMAGALQEGIRAQARDILAADLSVESRRPFDPRVEALLREGGATEITIVREFASMVAPVDADGNAGSSRLCMLKGVRGSYPLYGSLELDPPGSLDDALKRGVVVAPDLVRESGVRVGENLRVGTKVLPVIAVVTSEPRQMGIAAMLGPRVFVSEAHLVDSGLLGFGSRVRYRMLANAPNDELADLAALIEKDAPGAEYLTVQTWRSGQPRVQSAIGRVENYLGLVALLSLVLGGIGVAQIVRAWLAGRTQSIAILRCLGMTPREIMVLFLGQVTVLALIGCAVGALAGSLFPLVFRDLVADVIDPSVLTASLIQPAAILRGFGLGLAIAILFSLPSLTAVWRVSPAKVLRAEAVPLPAPRLIRYGTLAAAGLGVFGAAWAQASSPLIAAIFTVGLFGLAGILAVGARLAMRWSGQIPRGKLPLYLAQGLSALSRPGAGTTGGIVALGLGVMVIVSMVVVQEELSDGLKSLIPENAPTAFFVDVQPDQWEGVRSELDKSGATGTRNATIVMGRVRAINGRSVKDIAAERGGRAKWALTREQRMAPLAELPDDNVVVGTTGDGALWSKAGVHEISLEVRYARSLDVELGDKLTIDVQGIPIDYVLTSLRKVEWQSMSLNFFVVVEPGSLDGAPSLMFAAAKVPEEAEQSLQDALSAGYPNVSMIRVRPILEQVGAMMRQLHIGTRTLALFTIFAGLAILAGAIAASTLRRRREVALLKTLGATRRGVTTLFVTEFGLVGAVAGVLGSIGALVLAWGFLTGVADLEFHWPLWIVPGSALGAAVLSAMFGMLASLPALRAPPRESLRG